MKPLIINHKIYGKYKITQPILLELIKSPALQRLKKIDNRGVWIFHKSSPGFFNRYEHSIGVMLLLKKFDAPLEEQVAGLLHDVSHTAFSHISDYVFNSDYLKQDYQDSKLAQAFEIQGVNKILKKHHIKPSFILNEKNFPLLEKELPALCADRIDYSLGDPWLKKITKEKPKKFLKHLILFENKWAFTNQVWAKKFGKLYLNYSQQTWCSALQSSLYQVASEAIKLALEKNIITKKDLFTTDKFLMDKLKKIKNPEISKKINSLRNLKVKTVPKNKADFFTRAKPRVVDPYFLKNGKLVKLTTIDKAYKKEIDKWSKQAKKGFWIKILTS